MTINKYYDAYVLISPPTIAYPNGESFEVKAKTKSGAKIKASKWLMRNCSWEIIPVCDSKNKSKYYLALMYIFFRGGERMPLSNISEIMAKTKSEAKAKAQKLFLKSCEWEVTEECK